MKKVLKYILLFIVAVVAIILIAGLFISKKFHFEQSISINAPKEKVWQNINSLTAMDKWSPWNEHDPDMKKTMPAQDGIVGATQAWKGDKIGEGSQTIKKLDPPNRISTDLEFIKPFKNHADAYVALSDENGGTKATWAFDSEMSYPMNAISKIMTMVGGDMSADFTIGLNKLKALSEAN